MNGIDELDAGLGQTYELAYYFTLLLTVKSKSSTSKVFYVVNHSSSQLVAISGAAYSRNLGHVASA
jgi:hypothetical protein